METIKRSSTQRIDNELEPWAFADDINGTDAEEALIKIGHIFKCFLAAFFQFLTANFWKNIFARQCDMCQEMKWITSTVNTKVVYTARRDSTSFLVLMHRTSSIEMENECWQCSVTRNPFQKQRRGSSRRKLKWRVIESKNCDDNTVRPHWITTFHENSFEKFPSKL